MDQLDIAIVIVNYNTKNLLAECLNSIRIAARGLQVEVCVVDNASGDKSAEMVTAQFPEVHLIANRENVGYPKANNQGLRWFGFADEGQPLGRPPEQLPRYALLLNPDTVLPTDALHKMVAFLDEDPRRGAAGPRLIRPDGSLDLACRRSFPSPEISFYRMAGLSKLFPKSERFGRYNMTFVPATETIPVDSVVGAFMMVRREAIIRVGLLDETFFMYGEDLDWAYRIKAAGWEIWYNADVTVLHVKEAASKKSRKARYEFYRAMDIFYRKHYAATTPRPLGWLIRGGIALRGGIDIGKRFLTTAFPLKFRQP